jgi:hypothetical protein
MKKISIILIALTLIACTSQKRYDFPLDEYPETFFQQISKLPEENLEKMQAPTAFPFPSEYVTFTKNQNRNGIILTAGIDYEYEDNVNIHFTIDFKNNLKEKRDLETIKLSNGAIALINKDEDKIKSVQWREQSTLYTLSMVASDQYDKKITVEQLTVMANSMKKISLEK